MNGEEIRKELFDLNIPALHRLMTSAMEWVKPYDS